MNLTNSELRQRARKTLGGNIFDQKWLMALAVSFVLSAILSVASLVPSGIVTIIISGPIMVGLHKTFLIATRTKETITFNNAFDGFNNFAQAFLLGFLQSIFVMLWSLLFIIPGIVKSYAYSMAYYIMVDHPEYTW